MTIRPIKTGRDYRNALKEIEKLWEAQPNSPREVGSTCWLR
jgi:antitoxin component HigA of HigAB toxin-antitoxin module